ncbi:MAG TPA: ubiquinone biosynthesis protein [Desulfosporosinus sp.]|nr:ubiquinone biosynthesis protein [Desulfosporosinus sp.]
MDNKLIFRLKQFYTLETFQVAFYNAQSNSATDEYYKKAFEKMVEIEQGHADYFANIIDKANEEVPSVIGSVLQLAGSFVGETVESIGQHSTCKFGVTLENEAMKAYRKFIQESKEQEYRIIRDILMEYLLDEEFHTYWLREYMNNHPN